MPLPPRYYLVSKALEKGSLCWCSSQYYIWFYFVCQAILLLNVHIVQWGEFWIDSVESNTSLIMMRECKIMRNVFRRTAGYVMYVRYLARATVNPSRANLLATAAPGSCIVSIHWTTFLDVIRLFVHNQDLRICPHLVPLCSPIRLVHLCPWE